MNYPVYIIAMLACVIGSAYFSATETAFSSLNKTRIKTLAEDGHKRAKLVLKLSNDYDRLISTILIGNNIVNILAASLGTLMFVKLLGEDIGATVSTVVVTVVVLIFGEISPKSIAKDFPEKFAMFSAPIIQFLIWILTPLNFLFWLWKKFLSLFLKKKDDEKLSQAELLMFVEEVQEGGSIDTNEGHLLRNAIEFGDLKAEDILTHRVDLEALPVDATPEEVAEKFENSKFSRLPVYKEDIDHIVGILHLKDFYGINGITTQPISEIMTPPLFIHRTEKISDLLKQLQTTKSHMAVVVDEYGGTLGIVTMEDILEELVGDIWDEHDDVLEDVRNIGYDTYRVNCSMSMDDFCQQFDIDAQSESSTVNGWISEQLDKIPEKGDKFSYKNLDITVTDIDSHRPLFVSVHVNPVEEDENASDKDKKEE
ncbi:hemolysins and related proteins containing CBS domains [Corallococcus sp. CAG:1435]|nr:hemolysins and related proteins containing CBS domains [Corallococcus sp. CAG:1435]